MVKTITSIAGHEAISDPERRFQVELALDSNCPPAVLIQQPNGHQTDESGGDGSFRTESTCSTVQATKVREESFH